MGYASPTPVTEETARTAELGFIQPAYGRANSLAQPAGPDKSP